MAGRTDLSVRRVDLQPRTPMSTLSLATNSLLEGPAAGSDSIIVLSNDSWSASTTTPWLQITFDQNTGAARTAHITVLGASITLNQGAPANLSATIVETFSPSTVNFNGPSTLTFTLTDQSSTADTGGSFSQTLASGITTREDRSAGPAPASLRRPCRRG